MGHKSCVFVVLVLTIGLWILQGFILKLGVENRVLEAQVKTLQAQLDTPEGTCYAVRGKCD